MRLIDRIDQTNEKRDNFQLHFEREANVRIQLFHYLFVALDWNILNPKHGFFQFPEIGGVAAGGVFLDRELNSPILFEIKGIKENIDTYIPQTREYFSAEETIKISILSNMVDMYFFSDFETLGVMDAKPFYKIHLPSYSKQDLDFLELFRRAYFLDNFQEIYAKWKEQYTHKYCVGAIG